ncbi:M24 family metallopeptidase [Limnochorda pilosa]|uniref:Xaa-Pro dipeptidase n=1 Tax=Limnochorda pilosa TaxID=1555112 RepID=A0A0K2SMV1_LIMPI|nr:Xaa-Pro peptidase family protein [Limnochorda pilosa]BAS28440.1 Xaa-Pro dipeptidase [Limnochorda pilosa]
MQGRLERLRAVMAREGVGALLVGSPYNRRYLSGFWGSAGHVLVTPERQMLLVDFRYEEQARQQAQGFEVRRFDRLTETLSQVAAELGLRELAFESAHVTCRELERFQQAVEGLAWRPLGPVIEELRAVKEPQELRRIEEACRLADAAFDHVLGFLRPGVSEREVALELEFFMRRQGAEAVSFDPIVAAGPRGAMPHARPTDALLEQGQMVVLDFGCVLDGYCSDMTRTVAVGRADGQAREVYGLVLRAQEAGIAAVRAGADQVAVDRVARDVIEAAGHGEHYGHGLGHGVGLEVHEDPPRLNQTAEPRPLEAGMVHSVEPGVYLPGWGGVRIEDLVQVTQEGCRILSRASKEFLEVG